MNLFAEGNIRLLRSAGSSSPATGEPARSGTWHAAIAVLRAHAWSIVVACMFLGLPLNAGADEPKGDEARGRDLYVLGTEAANAGRWADALKRFQASYSLAPNAAALFNAAVALRALGRHKEARNAFDRVLDEHGDDLDAATRRSAEDLRAESTARLAKVHIATFAGCDLRLDGKAITSAGSMRALEIDPGAHTFSAECPRRHTMTKELTLGEGTSTNLSLEPELIQTVVVTRQAPPPSPVPWILIGVGGAVAIAGAIMIGVGAVDRSRVENAEDGTPWTDVDSANDRATIFSWLGPTLLGTGALTALGGVIWFQLDDSEPTVGLRWSARF